MSDNTITQQSRKFYEQFQFPGQRPIDQDGLIFMRRFTKSIENRTLENNGGKLRVLDAGCGTGNTSIALARRFGHVDFVGLDNSKASLEKAIASSQGFGLLNLRHRRWNLMNPLPFKDQFDIILCLGVLHHTADMGKGLANLRRCLKSDGELYLWIYGKHGRYRHSLNMRLLAMLLKTKPAPINKVELAREFIFNADDGSALIDLLGKVKPDKMQKQTLEDPVWIADQFLNPHEILLDMEELIDLVGSSGFEIDHVLGMSGDVARHFHSVSLFERFRTLDNVRQLIALDLLLKPERYFVVLRRAAKRKKR